MPATLTTAAKILKEVYQPGLAEQINKEAIAIKRIEQSKGDGIETRRTGGKYVRFGIRTGRNPGIGYRAENGALPTGGNQTYEDVQIPLAYGYGMLQLTGQVMRLAESDYQAFVNVMDDEQEGLRSDVVKDANRIVYGDGTGALAVLSGTQTVANQSTVANTQYLEVGQKIDIVSTGGTVRGSNRAITAITGLVVTYDGADVTTDANTDLIVRTGNWALEPNGLASIVKSSGALYDVDPANFPVWTSTVDSNASVNRALSEALMISVIDRVRTAGGGQPSVILTSLGVRRSYFSLLVQQRRFTDKEFPGGFKGLPFNYGTEEIPLVCDPDAPTNKMWFVSEDKLPVFREADWQFDDTDGSMWSRVSGFDAFEARLYKYWQVGVRQRNAHALISDISES